VLTNIIYYVGVTLIRQKPKLAKTKADKNRSWQIKVNKTNIKVNKA
jgi:hypothetical protein